MGIEESTRELGIFADGPRPSAVSQAQLRLMCTQLLVGRLARPRAGINLLEAD